MARTKRRFGYRPDKPDARDWDEGKLGLVARALPRAISLRPFCPEVYDQGASSTCVAQTIGGAIEVLERRAQALNDGFSVGRPSRLFMYYNSRKLHSSGPVVFDTGTYLRTCVDGMRKLGVPDESAWPFSTRSLRINRRPAFNAYMLAHGRRGGEYFRIQSTGEDRIRAIKAALAEGYPVAFGTRVTESFLDSNGPIIVDKPLALDPVVGGHAMLIVGYEEREGGLVFEVRNSWGADYRDDGYVWFTEDAIRWVYARDFQIVRGWDRLRKAVSA